jgi:hypothetical protein
MRRLRRPVTERDGGGSAGEWDYEREREQEQSNHIAVNIVGKTR